MLDYRTYREASALVIQLLDSKGDPLHVIRFARMPEAHKTSLAKQMKAEVIALRLRYPDAPIQALADGAAENWRILSELEQAVGFSFEMQTVDLYHASEHLAAGLKASGALAEEIHTWLKTLCEQPGGAQLVLTELAQRNTKLPKRTPKSQREELRKQLVYFTNNYERMDYAGAKEKGIPIGSGMQEAACKTLVVQRLKLSGVSWGKPGGQALFTIRGLLQSNRYELAWRALRSARQLPITIQREPVRQRPSYGRHARPTSIRECG